MDPERATGAPFAATVYAIDASPCPSRAPLMEIQLTSLAIVQVQSRSVDTRIVPDPPAAANDEDEAERSIWQRPPLEVGAVATAVSLELHATKSEAVRTAMGSPTPFPRTRVRIVVIRGSRCTPLANRLCRTSKQAGRRRRFAASSGATERAVSALTYTRKRADHGPRATG